MSRIDDPTIYNPYGWRLADLEDPTTTPERRSELIEDLFLWEAEEVAHGYRHLTVVHGCPGELAESCHLDTFYDTLRSLAVEAGWVRVRGTVNYVTVTVRGAHADQRIDALITAAHAANPSAWVITPSAYPPLPIG